MIRRFSVLIAPSTRTVGAWFCLLLAAVTSPVARAEGERLPVPSKESCRASTAKVREIFGADAAKANTAEAKAKFARELLGHAKETDAAVDQYVLLESARSLAMEAGDLTTVLDALRLTSERFTVDLHAARLEALESLAAKAPPAALGRVVDLLLETADAAANDGDLAKAEDIVQSAVNAGRRGKDREKQKIAVDRLTEIRSRVKLQARAKPLEERLRQNPNDGEAAEELGRLRCFVEDDWAAGLPLLARGSDADLATIAKMELAAPTTPSERIAIADLWFSFFETHKGSEATAAASRSKFHYSLAIERLTGLDRARVLKRIESLAASAPGQSKRPSGLVLWLDAAAPGALRGADGQPIQVGKGARETPLFAWADVPSGKPLALQKNAQLAPVVAPDGFGGKPAVLFRGHQWLATDVPSTRQGTLAVVFRVDSTAIHSRIIGAAADSAGVRLQTRVGGKMGGEVSAGGPQADEVWSPEQYLSDRMSVVAIMTWPMPFCLYLNGKQYNAGRPQQADPTSGKGTVIGAYDDKGIIAFQGAVAEVMLYDRILSNPEILSLQGSLAAKWGVK